MRRILCFLEKNSRATTIIIFCLAFIVRLTFLLFDGDRLFAEQPGEAMLIAKSLIRDGTFANAYGEGTGPTTHTTPLYPLLIALILILFHNGAAGYAALRVLTCGSAALIYAMLPKIAEMYGFSKRAGIIGAFIGAVVPYGRYETDGSFENILTTTVFFGFLLILNRIGTRYALSFAPMCSIGALTGLIALLGASFLPAALFATYDFLRRHHSVFRISAAAAFIFGFCAILSPWVVRNYLVFKTFIPIRGNFWLEVAVSNQQNARPTLRQNIKSGIFQRIHPFSNKKERERYKSMGEVSYMQEKKIQAISWIASHPAEFIHLCLKRLAAFLFFPSIHLTLTILMMGVVILAAVGTAACYREAGDPVALLRLWGLVLAFGLIHVVIQVSERYRYPAHVVLLIPCGCLLALIWSRLEGQRACQ